MQSLNFATQPAHVLTALRVGFWNIHGYKSPRYPDKFLEPDFLNILTEFDIFGLVETHRPESKQVIIPGYYIFRKARPKIITAKCESGGLIIGIKEHLRAGISILSELVSTEYIWIRLHKKFFNLHSDLFIAFCYISPQDSSFAKRQCTPVINTLRDSINQLGPHPHYLIAGDFNARIAEHPGIAQDIPTEHVPVLDGVPQDNSYLPRHSHDLHNRGWSQELIELCTGEGAIILNGHTLGDLQGALTYQRGGADSVIDYIIASHTIHAQIDYFNVMAWNPLLSDHSPVYTKITLPRTTVVFDTRPPPNT